MSFNDKTFNFRVIVANLVSAYLEKRKLKGYLGSLYIPEKQKEIILSRCSLQDRELMDQGSNDFDYKENKYLVDKFLQENVDNGINPCEFDPLVHYISQVMKLEEDEFDDDMDIDGLLDDYGRFEYGFPTSFTSSKSHHKVQEPRNAYVAELRRVVEGLREWLQSELRCADRVSQAVLQRWRDLKLNVSNTDVANAVQLMQSDETPPGLVSGSYHRLMDLAIAAFQTHFRMQLSSIIEHIPNTDEYQKSVRGENMESHSHLLGCLGFVYASTTEEKNLMSGVYPVLSETKLLPDRVDDFCLRTVAPVSSEATELEEENDDNNSSMDKYYYQRYRFFSRFDEGILLDEESWYSVTPEVIAQHVADRFCSVLKSGQVIIDAFCGSGGNTIRFAEKGFTVVAVDMDPHKLSLLWHNADVHGVRSRVVPVLADFHSLPATVASSSDSAPAWTKWAKAATAVHLSPPWGGPAYLSAPSSTDENSSCSSLRLDALLDTARALLHDNNDAIAVYVPRNIDLHALARFWALHSSTELEVEQLCVEGKVKALNLYTGSLVRHRQAGLPH